MYALTQDVAFDAMSVTINGREKELSDIAEMGNSINDCFILGENLIIDTHVNPHRNEYIIYNLRSDWVINRISGGVFLAGEEYWDSFVSDMDTVYDAEGHAVHTVEDAAEICNLSFIDHDMRIKIEYWKDDYTDVYEEIIDRPECLNAPIYVYEEFLRHQTSENWERFLSYDPDAILMVMIDPHASDEWDFYMPKAVNGQDGADILYVVSMQDQAEVHVGRGPADVLAKGDMTAYSLTVPEGVPEVFVTADISDGRYAEWPVCMISGKDDIRWVFVDESVIYTE